MHFLAMAAWLPFPGLAATVLGSPNMLISQQTNLNQSLPLTLNLNSSMFNHTIQEYETYGIPNTDLTLHLTLLRSLDPVAMGSCLNSAKVWISFQKSEEELPQRDFEWKDSTGALFYIRSLSLQLTWGIIGKVLSGLLKDLYDNGRYLALSFTVEDRSLQLFIGLGRLSKYEPVLPTLTPDRSIVDS